MHLVKWLLLACLLITCTQREPEGPKPEEPSTPVDEAPVPDAEEVPYEIIEIPTTRITIHQPPLLLPGRARGLSFQMGNQVLPPGAQLHQPLADALLTPDHDVVLCFPDHQQIVRFNHPKYGTEIFGPAETGLQLNRPTRLACWQDRIYISQDNRTDIEVINRQGVLIDHFQTGNYTNAVIGPGNHALVIQPQQPRSLIRLNEQGKKFRSYVFFETPEHDDPIKFRSGCVAIRQDWTFEFVNLAGNRIASYREDGIIDHLFELDTTLLGDVYAVDIEVSEDRLWVMYVDFGNRLTYLMRFTHGSDSFDLFRAPFFADGLSVSSRFLLLFDREKGAAQTWAFDVVD
ncbi:MAG: hypothetical protein KDC35_16400 [Acidobacteria bacterium]|nr:hypothetical protein [Acidobacteriota bacterium]